MLQSLGVDDSDVPGVLRYRQIWCRRMPLMASLQRYCFDRFWANAGAAQNTRYLCSGHALIVVGDARAEFHGCGDRGVRAQFRHPHFPLFLIAHFQKAALLMSSDRLVEALKKLDVGDATSVRRFKHSMRASFEGFLRFTPSRPRCVRCSTCAPRISASTRFTPRSRNAWPT